MLIEMKNCDWLAVRPRKSYVVSAQSQQTLSRMQSMHEQNGALSSIATSYRSVVPISQEPSPESRAPTGKAILMAANREAVIETALLLHENESVAVVGYIEAVVPVIYALYIAILSHLPNPKFYKDMEGMTEDKLHSVLLNILIYAFMELLSLLYVHLTIKRHFGISVFYQLVFVLESEWPTY